MIKEHKPRAKRYTRLDQPPNFQITPRIVRVLKIICNHPLIRVDQIALLAPDIPYDSLKTIIFNLFHAGLIAKPIQQAELHNSVPGSLSMFVSPDRLGYLLYSLFFADPLPTPKYTQENDRGKWNYIKHQHTTATTAMQYQLAAQPMPGLTHLTQSDLWLKYAPTNRLNNPRYNPEDFPRLMSHDFLADPSEYMAVRSEVVPLKLKTRIEWDIKLPGNSHLTSITMPVSTEPDEYSGYTYNNRTRFTFHESDEGTETILPNATIRQSMQLFFDTSLYQKLLVYIAAFRHRAHLTQFGITSFDVEITTSTPTRADNIIRQLGPLLLRQFHIHPNFVRLTDRQTIAHFDSNPYHPDLRRKNLEGQELSLLKN
ncbi:MAG: hypothetical protein OES09_10820 [Gammaproteobacteria bacterium]|nr:hypothetical protein [Gammaproteobacteria bacterium]